MVVATEEGSIRFVGTGLAVVADYFSVGTAFASIVAAVSIVIEGPTASHLSTVEGCRCQGYSATLVVLPSTTFVAHFAACLLIGYSFLNFAFIFCIKLNKL